MFENLSFFALGGVMLMTGFIIGAVVGVAMHLFAEKN